MNLEKKTEISNDEVNKRQYLQVRRDEVAKGSGILSSN